MDTADLIIENIKIDNNTLKKFLRYNLNQKVIDLTTEEIIEREPKYISEKSFKNYKISYIEQINIDHKKKKITVKKFSIPKALGHEDNNVVINNKDHIYKAFSKLIKKLKEIGLHCMRKHIHFTRVDYPVHIKTGEFDSWKNIFNLLSFIYKSKIYFEPSIFKNISTGILLQYKDGIEINIYNKLKQMNYKKTPSRKSPLSTSEKMKKFNQYKTSLKNKSSETSVDVLRIETRFIEQATIKEWFGGNTCKEVTLDNIKINLDKIYGDISKAIFRALALEVCYLKYLFKDHPQKKRGLSKELYIHQNDFSDIETLKISAKAIAIEEGWTTSKLEETNSTINQVTKTLSSYNGDYYNNLPKLQQLFNKFLGSNISSKKELIKSLDSDLVELVDSVIVNDLAR